MKPCNFVGFFAVALGGLAFQSLALAQSDVTQPGDPLIASSTNSPGSETGPNAIDNQPTKHLNFDTTGTTPTPSGLVVSPSVGVTLLSGINIQSANDAVERDPKWIRLEGSNDAAPTWTTGDWEVIYENNAVQPWTARFQTQTFLFDNDKPFAHYRFTVLEVQGTTANSTQYAEIELLGEVLPGDVTQPGDALTSSSTNSPGSETGPNAIDGQPTKYLNFDTTGAAPVPSGLIVTPGIGSTVLLGMTIQSANDAVERDPKWVRLEGSNDAAPMWDSGNWSVIYENNAIEPWTALFPGNDRFQTQTFIFEEQAPYLHYRWTVLEVQGTTANSMQVAEVELLGRSAPVDVTQPGDPLTASSTNSPGSEAGPNAIDNQPTKHLNFDTTGAAPVPSGFVVTPSVGATRIVGLSIQSANDAVERDPKVIRLEGSNDEAPGWASGNWDVLYENSNVPPWTARFQTQRFYFFDNRTSYLHYRFTVSEVQGTTANSTQYAEIELLAYSESAPCDKADFLTHPVDTPVLLGSGAGAEFFTRVNGPWPVQWLKNGEPIPGAVQTRYTTGPVSAENESDVYTVEIKGCHASDPAQAYLFDPADQPVSVGINFAGQGANGAPTVAAATDIGGFQPQAYWNNLPPTGNGTPAGSQSDLRDSRNESTGITVEWVTTASWGSGTGADDTNAKILNGLVEGGADEAAPATITFTGVPEGKHSLFIYSVARPLEFPDAGFLQVESGQRIYMRQFNADQHNPDPGFTLVTTTDPANPGVGNFARIDAIEPVEGVVTLNFWDSGGSGNSTVNAVQLVLDALLDPPVGSPDTDGDGLPDIWEEAFFGDLSRDGSEDFDDDGLIDSDELANKSDPSLKDTDGDGLEDGPEVFTHGSSPRRKDTDGDTLSDFDEVTVHQTDPADSDSDDDGVVDSIEVHPFFDTDPNDAGSTPDVIQAVQSGPWMGPATWGGTAPVAGESYVALAGIANTLTSQPGAFAGDSLTLIGTKLVLDHTGAASANLVVSGATIESTASNTLGGTIEFLGDSTVEVGSSTLTLNSRLSGSDGITIVGGSADTPSGHLILGGAGSTLKGDSAMIGTDVTLNTTNALLGTGEGGLLMVGGRLNVQADSQFCGNLDIQSDIFTLLLAKTLTVRDLRGMGPDGSVLFTLHGVFGNTDLTPDDLVNTVGFSPEQAPPADGMITLNDALECGETECPYPPAQDTDGDGLTDCDEEREYGTDRAKADTDDDGLDDGDEILVHGTLPRDADTDDDGLSDGSEINTHLTNPLLADTDGDGFSDKAEVDNGSNPLNSEDFPATFIVRTLASTGGLIDTLDAARNLRDGVIPGTETVSFDQTINFTDDLATLAMVPGDILFYGGVTDDFIVHAIGIFEIPEAGMWGIGFNTDDGGELIIDGGTPNEQVLVYAPPRGRNDTFGTLQLSAGIHTLEFLMYERGGGAGAEVYRSAAPGDYGASDNAALPAGFNPVAIEAAKPGPPEAAPFWIYSIVRNPDSSVVLTWPAAAEGASHKVQYSPDMSEPFADIATGVTGGTFTDSEASRVNLEEGYYRVGEE